MCNNVEVTYKWFYLSSLDDQEYPANKYTFENIDSDIWGEEYETEFEAITAFSRYCEEVDWGTQDKDYVLKQVFNKGRVC